MKLEAIYNAAIVQPQELEETMYGNIVVPDLGNEKNKTGKVISPSPNRSKKGRKDTSYPVIIILITGFFIKKQNGKILAVCF